MHQQVVLHPGREKSIFYRHPWIFSGAVMKLPFFENGDMLQVVASDGKHLGYGYFNRASQIVGRLVSFDKTTPFEAIEQHIKAAITLRKALLGSSSAYRLIHAENDFLPGLVIDRYNDAYVIQISTLGMDKVKKLIVGVLCKELAPSWIVEVSTSASRKQEGLKPTIQTLYGTPVDSIEIEEDGLRFSVSPLKGQKTGFFYDLREMRLLIQKLSANKRVLNCCSFTGAFSLHALKGGASKVVSVDISKEAIEASTGHVSLNGFDTNRHEAVVSDVFEYLQNHELDYDIVILDPPAFAKQRKDVTNASKAYRELNRLALSKMAPQSLLLTCSCSYHVDEELFTKLLFQAALGASKDVRIVQRHRLAFDHLVNLYHPEGSYLKSLLCYIS
jgi:23S rRNA (cytosine1962-C5)-methyltransferase